MRGVKKARFYKGKWALGVDLAFDDNERQYNAYKGHFGV